MVHAEGSAGGIESARRRATLVGILSSAGVDNDIVNDVADACEIKEYTVMHLASEELSAETIAQELYLTDDEAVKLQKACRAELEKLGVSLVEGGELPSPLEEEEEEVTQAPAPIVESEVATSPAPVDASPVPVDASPAPVQPEEDREEECMTPEVAEGGLVTPPPAPAPTPATVCESVSSMGTVNTPVQKTPAPRPSRPQSAPPKSQKSLPSYAKPTSSAKLKKVKEEEALAAEKAMRSRPASASVKISASLLRPTAASKAYSTGKSEAVKARLNATCTGVDTHGRSKGPTTPRPFNLSSTKKENILSTDELQVAMAKAKMQALKEERMKASRVMSAPPKQRQQQERPLTEFKPFSLTSMALHEKARNTLAQQAEEEKRKEAKARQFKARNATYGKGKTYSDVRSTVEKKLSESKTFTVGQGPKFMSEQRIEVHKQLDEERRIKEAERKAQEAEAERLAKEQEELEIKEMRKQLQFHAQGVPDFSSPFKPDFSASPAPTQAKTPRFATDMRAPRKPTQGEADPSIGVPSADNQHYFASTLRGDTASRKPAAKDVHVTVKAV